MTKWYMKYRSSNLLSKEERKYLDGFTEEEFNNKMITGYNSYVINRSKITIKDAILEVFRCEK